MFTKNVDDFLDIEHKTRLNMEHEGQIQTFSIKVHSGDTYGTFMKQTRDIHGTRKIHSGD